MRNIILLLLFCLLSMPALAQQPDLTSFAQVPIMHEGRIKPMVSFAQAQAKYFSGSDENALPWLVEVLFDPSQAENRPALKVTNPDLLGLLALERRQDKLYAYTEIVRALAGKRDIYLSAQETPPEQRTPAQRDLLVLEQKAVDLGDLLGSLTAFLPLSVTLSGDVPEAFAAYKDKPLSYVDALKFREALQENVKSIVRNKGEDVSRYTENEQSLAYLAFTTDHLQKTGSNIQTFRVIPKSDQPWQSPWSILQSGTGSPETTKLFGLWHDLAFAYNNDDHKTWMKLTSQIKDETMQLGGNLIRPGALKTEQLYNTLQPFYISACFYALALLLLTAGLLLEKNILLRLLPLTCVGGIAFHLLGLVMRIYILERPPVSTLYESILFVGFIAVVYAFWLYLRERRIFWAALGAGLGVILHLIGFSHDQDGDSMLMLTAVLNTNFWLATHVICITAGYAFCILTSALAHVALLKTAFLRLPAPDPQTFRVLHTTALVALLFSAVGTVLGGIWADQSWGRFWGWDPKENGALLIVLWLIWLLHGRISACMKSVAVTAGLAALSVIVGLSWFGVNLLNVGLHSYGFTNSAAYSLWLFSGLDLALIGALWILVVKRAGRHAV